MALCGGAAASPSRKGWQGWDSRAQGDEWLEANQVEQQARCGTVSRAIALQRALKRPYRLAGGKMPKLVPTGTRFQTGGSLGQRA
jgi:hypothetical protein